jgi:hypothetical protein
MDIRQLAELRLQTGYVFENGTPFYEKFGEERAEALLKALLTYGYRIVSEQELTAHRATSLRPSDDAAQRTAFLASRKRRRRSGGPAPQMGG